MFKFEYIRSDLLFRLAPMGNGCKDGILNFKWFHAISLNKWLVSSLRGMKKVWYTS